MPEIAFNATHHHYMVDGQRWPSVTEILSPLSSFDGIPPDVLERKRQLGQAVHEMCSLALQDRLDEASLDDEMRAYLTGFRRFLSESGVTPIASELIVHHPMHRYCGTLDLIVMPPRKNARTKWLIDVKCAAAVPVTVGPQTIAYAKAYGQPVARKVLRLWPQDYRLDSLTEDSADWSVFLSAKTIHAWRKRNGLV